MLLSRFWYVLVGVALAGAVYLLLLATNIYNHTAERDSAQLLAADSQVVDWYLRSDARERASELLRPALERGLATALDKASATQGELGADVQDAARKVLAAAAAEIPRERGFDALLAVDQHGRVVAQTGFDAARGRSDFELGGYPVVADALHGYVRDDVLSLDRLYRVVARPVEIEPGHAPVGAVVGARLLDDRFAKEISKRTGAAIAFYVDGHRVAAAAPEGTDASSLDAINRDLATLPTDATYAETGRSAIRSLPDNLSVMYSRLPGEAGQQQAGFAVASHAATIASPLAFFSVADDKDKAATPFGWALIALAGAALVGLVLTLFEHTRPLSRFRKEVRELEAGHVERLRAAQLSGRYRDIAAMMNDAVDKLIEKSGGQSRRAANLGEVLGALPAQPVMSAFAFPEDGRPSLVSEPGKNETATAAPLPSAGSLKSSPLATAPLGSKPNASAQPVPPPAPSLSQPRSAPPTAPSARPAPPAPIAAVPPPDSPQERDLWHCLYEEFVATRGQLGDHAEGYTYEKFEGTLRKHRAAIQEKHGCDRVRFKVYVKDGKAALKASPVH